MDRQSKNGLYNFGRFQPHRQGTAAARLLRN
nr:MAG TPA: hypothetical protein [Caudoviricetes sp.]